MHQHLASQAADAPALHQLALHQQALLGAISPTHLLSTFGVIGVLVILLAEMGVLVGFFLPGDSLLFVAGYATNGHNSLHLHLPLGWLMIAAAAGAVIGGQVGYEVGRRAELRLQDRPESRYYKREYVERADRFLERFGMARTVVLSRFVPIVRTFASPIVGVAAMPVPSYTTWNLIGGLVWTVPIILLGHWLGHISFIRHYIEGLAVIIVILAIVPALVHMARHRGAASS
ncbi:MAG TPA: VTT domain-containing protein [Mycobacteriales bacterium]|nr:VTT domain-containing protein [Mycobacteriales bacterium]